MAYNSIEKKIMSIANRRESKMAVVSNEKWKWVASKIHTVKPRYIEHVDNWF
jgi:hypothetical protein